MKKLQVFTLAIFFGGLLLTFVGCSGSSDDETGKATTGAGAGTGTTGKGSATTGKAASQKALAPQ